MCTHCKNLLGEFVRAHDVLYCPMMKGLYCPVCAGYGHAAMDCPRATSDAPQFLEQLIPPSLLVQYGITTRTPIVGVPAVAAGRRPPIEVPNTEDEVKACLISLGGKPMNCQATGKEEKKEFAENTKRLQKLADTLGRQLILQSTTPPEAPKPKPPAKPKKTFTLRKVDEGTSVTA